MSSSGAPRKWSGRNPNEAKLRSTSRTNASRIASRPSWLPAPGKFSPFGPDHSTSSANASRKRSTSPCPNAFSASSTASARPPTFVARGVSPAPTLCLADSTRLFARWPSPLLSSDISVPSRSSALRRDPYPRRRRSIQGSGGAALRAAGAGAPLGLERGEVGRGEQRVRRGAVGGEHRRADAGAQPAEARGDAAQRGAHPRGEVLGLVVV